MEVWVEADESTAEQSVPPSWAVKEQVPKLL